MRALWLSAALLKMRSRTCAWLIEPEKYARRPLGIGGMAEFTGREEGGGWRKIIERGCNSDSALQSLTARGTVLKGRSRGAATGVGRIGSGQISAELPWVDTQSQRRCHVDLCHSIGGVIYPDQHSALIVAQAPFSQAIVVKFLLQQAQTL